MKAHEQATRDHTLAIDYYRILQIDPDAPPELVVEAYWCLADRLKAELPVRRASESELSALNEAYAVLSDTAQREAYDKTISRVVELRQERAERARTRRRKHSSRSGRVSQVDCYELLCVDEAAPAALIARAYFILRTLRTKEGALREHLAKLAEAHSLLLNAETRKDYDASRKDRAAPAQAEAKAGAQPEMLERAPETSTDPSPTVEAPEGLAGRPLEASETAGMAPAGQRASVLRAFVGAAAKGGRTALAAGGGLLSKTATKGSSVASAKAKSSGGRLKRRRQQEAQSKTGELPDERLLRDAVSSAATPQPAEEVPQPLSPARLVLDHPLSGRQVIGLGETPVTLGGDESCDIRLTAEPGEVASEHARIWFAGGRFVIRSLDPLYPTIIGGQSVNWAGLDDGDEIEIGAYRLRFEAAHALDAPPDFLTTERNAATRGEEIPERHE